MRILYVNVIEQNAGCGAEWFINRAFQELGHSTHNIDFRKHRFSLYRKFLDAPESDVLFVQKGDGLPLALLKAVARPRFYWACDILGLGAEDDLKELDPVYDRTQYRLLASGLFEHVFLRTPNCIETVVSKGRAERKQCSILSSGFDPRYHHPITNALKDIPVLFLGTPSARRQEIIGRVDKIHPVQVLKAFGLEMTELMNRAKIVLNIHAGPVLDTETRVYEALGCGAFLLTERLSPENPFSNDDLVQFDSVEDLIDKIGYYLAHDQERQAIATHGHQTALAGHTYLHRAKQIVNTMSQYLKPNESSKPMIKHSLDLYAYAVSENMQRLRNSPVLDPIKRPIKTLLHRPS